VPENKKNLNMSSKEPSWNLEYLTKKVLVSGRVPSIVFAPLFHGPVLGCPSKLGSMVSKWAITYL